MASPLTAALLGSPEFSHNGTLLTEISDRKALALLTYLAVQNRPEQRSDLAELLWGAGKLNNLRQLLYKIRQLDGADDWLTNDDPVTLNIRSDVAAFEAAVSAERYDEALMLWRGTLLTNFKPVRAPAFMDWLELQRSRLSQLYEEALTGRLETLEDEEQFEKAVPLARAALERDPLNETAHRTLMRLEYKRGNTDAALEQFERLREALRDELGVEPLPETLELLKEIEEGGAGASKRALLITIAEAIPERPERLIGRDELLGRTSNLLGADGRVLIHGFGGIGKTALAATLAEAYLSTGSVVWLELGQDDPATSLDALADPFNAQQSLAQAADKSKLLATLLAESGVGLIVLDDVWNAYTLSVLLDTLPPDVPLLVTSRQRYPRLKRVNVGRLSREAGLELLGLHAAQHLAKDAGADALCNELGDHAFALRVAGITLASDALTPQELLERVKRAPLDLRVPDSLARQDQGNIASLLQVSLDTLDDRAYDTFLAYGALYSPSSTAELMATLLERDTEQTEDALFRLVERGLAERVATAGSDTVTYRVHDLSHAYARAINNLRDRSVIRAAKTYLGKHADTPDTVDAELSNILGAADAATDSDLVEFMRLLTVDGTYYTARGHNTRSIRLLQEAIAKAKLLEDFELVHDLSGKLGDAYQNLLGDLQAAEKAYQEALEYTRISGNRAREAIFLSILGVIKFKQGTKDADAYLQQAYQLAREIGDDLCLCTILEQRGYLEGIRQDVASAEKYLSESLAAIERLEKTKDKDENDLSQRKFFCLTNLAQAQHELGNIETALSSRQQSLSLATKLDNELWQALALFGIGESFHAMNKRDEAQSVLEESLSLYQHNKATAYIKALEEFMISEGYS